ncbi:hypothetical protein [Desulfovibrio sp. SGI.169]|uniref:hypothetical protein n=1 Tax=Desulfovibrio sp. SGI.169 TaxID=3420561 RepID=UPI003D04F8E0
MLSLGLLLPAGTAALSFGLLLSIAAGQVPLFPDFSMPAVGWAPRFLHQFCRECLPLAAYWGPCFFLGIPSLMLLPLAFWLCRHKTNSPRMAPVVRESGRSIIFSALGHRNYIFLILAFFTCGFHMSILETHFFNQLLTFGFSRETAAILFSVYGLLTMVGSALSGLLCCRISMKNLLGSIYAVRIILAIMLIIMPKMMIFIITFIIILGLTSDSTVSPTAGLILKDFGVAKLPTLFGLAFLTHQIGCFSSAWIGGILVKTTGVFEYLWLCDAVLSAMASTVSYLVREKY